MRWTAADQLGVAIPEATDQPSFGRLGLEYGCFADNLPVRGRLTDGTRLSVLSAALSANILATVRGDDSADTE